MTQYIWIFLASVFISSCSQILLKYSANQVYKSRIREYLNVPVIAAYMILVISSLLTIVAYRKVPLSMGPILEATGYIWVTVLGKIVLKEKVSKRKVLGLGVIFCGVLVFCL